MNNNDNEETFYDYRKGNYNRHTEHHYELSGSDCLELIRCQCENQFSFFGELIGKCQTIEETKRLHGTLVSVLGMSSKENGYDKFEGVFRAGSYLWLDDAVSEHIYCIEKGILEPVVKTERTAISAELRNYILLRGQCAYCKSTTNLHVDHIVPLAKGGSNDRANLQCLCRTCNILKNAKYEAEIIADLRRQILRYEEINEESWLTEDVEDEELENEDLWQRAMDDDVDKELAAVPANIDCQIDVAPYPIQGNNEQEN